MSLALSKSPLARPTSGRIDAALTTLLLITILAAGLLGAFDPAGFVRSVLP